MGFRDWLRLRKRKRERPEPASLHCSFCGRSGVEAKKLLADNDGYGFFSALDDLIVTGPTRTNVNDYRVILIET